MEEVHSSILCARTKQSLMIQKAEKFPILIAIVCGLVTLLAILFSSRDLGNDHQIYIQARMFYWLMVEILCLASAAGIYFFVNRRIFPSKRALLALLYCVLLSGICYRITPSQMRIQWDEANLLSTSKGMYLEHADEYVFESIVEHGNIAPLFKTQDKRPPLFPFLVSILHHARGFSIGNAFVLNLAVLTLLLFIGFQFTMARFGIGAALAAPLFLVSSPLIVFSATSAGFDLFSASILMLVLWIAFDFIQRPTFDSLLLFVSTGLLFVYSRYESALIFLALGFIMLWMVRGRSVLGQASKILIGIVPIFVAPIAMLGLTAKRLQYFQQDSLLAGGDIFSWKYLVEHLFIFMREFFRCDFSHSFCGVINLLGLGALLSALYFRKLNRATLIIFAGAILPLLITLSFYYGDARNFTAARLFLPVTIILSLCPLMVLKILPSKYLRNLLPVFAALCFVSTFPGLKEGEIGFISDTSRAVRMLEVLLPQARESARNSLYVFKQPSFLNLEDFASVDLAVFLQNKNRIHDLVRRGEIRSIYFIDIDPPKMNTSMREFLKKQKYQGVLEIQKPGISLRIFRLLSIDTALAQASP